MEKSTDVNIRAQKIQEKVQIEDPDFLFEIGQLYSDRGDYALAVESLNKASSLYLKQCPNLPEYLRSQNLLLKIHAEREDHPAIDNIRAEIQKLIENKSLNLSSKSHYTLALCLSYQCKFEEAQEHLQSALELSQSQKSLDDEAYARLGLSMNLYSMGRIEESHRQLEQIEKLLPDLENADILVSQKIMLGHIFRQNGKFEDSLKVLWSAYDQMNRRKDLRLYSILLYAIGKTYLASKDSAKARTYFSLAFRMVDAQTMRYLSRKIKQAISKLDEDVATSYDLVLNEQENTLIESTLGRVDFHNQFILVALLRMFVTQPGKVFSKETLVQKIWKQDYDPSRHDNKVYVTIMRLRKMIEPDLSNPKYIFRAKNGYYFSKTARVDFQSSPKGDQ